MGEMRTCQVSGESFLISDEELDFFQKIGVPPPTLSPLERQRRRFQFRNERAIYKRKSSLSGELILSVFHPEEPIVVYSPEEWFSDAWEGADFGKPYDFSRSFFEQFRELQQQVPALSLQGFRNENSPYCNYAADCKNCHLIFGSINCEDCLYGNPYYCKDCIDSLLIRNCELCYECITCEKCYECIHCHDCVGSNNLLFCYDCKGCKDCVGCVGLRGKQYCLFNEELSRDDYLAQRRSISLCDAFQRKQFLVKYQDLLSNYPRQFAVFIDVENVSGDYIYHSKNTYDSYDVQRCEDTRYVCQAIDMKDCYDCNYTEENELCYEYIANFQNQRSFFSLWLNGCSDVWYSSYCLNSQDLFGCIGLRRKSHCILNKQYSEADYNELRAQIIKQMTAAHMFGEFFPPAISPFCYNETVANEYFPLTELDASARGLRWRESDTRDYMPQTVEVPENIRDVPDSILKEILSCESCSKNYRIERLELGCLKRNGLPIPKYCPDCRHQQRIARRNPRCLWERCCEKCGVELKTTYNPEKKEIVYCEECYIALHY